MKSFDYHEQKALSTMSLFEKNYHDQIILHNDIRNEYDISSNSRSVVVFFLQSEECKSILRQIAEMDRDIRIVLRSISLARIASDNGIQKDFIKLSRVFFNQAKSYHSKWQEITKNTLKLIKAIEESGEY